MSGEFRAPEETFLESPRLQAELLAHALGADPRVLDFVARAADAWDGRGVVTLSVHERRALCELAGLGARHADGQRWEDLSGEARRSILIGLRRAIEFARACAWVFGEGEGPRL